MSPNNEAVKTAIGASRIVAEYDGLSAGLNANPTAARLRARLIITHDGVILVALRRVLGFPAGWMVERFEARELLDICEEDLPMTGLLGLMSEKSASTNAGMMHGWTNLHPTLSVRTRRGDFLFALGKTRKGRARCRRALNEISSLISDVRQ